MAFNRDDIYREILKTYGHKVSIENKAKTLRKFGRNDDLDTGVEEMVWNVGDTETLPTTNTITHYASSDAGDAQSATVEGHTVDGSGNLTFVVQSITLAGQTKTALSTPLARATRLYNTSATDFSGVIYVAKDVTFTGGVPASDIHIQVNGSDNQSLKAATSISQFDYWIVESLFFSVRRQSAASVDFRFQVREKGKVWRTQLTAAVSNSSGTVPFHLANPIIVPPNSDTRVLATASANNTQVDATIDGTLAIII